LIAEFNSCRAGRGDLQLLRKPYPVHLLGFQTSSAPRVSTRRRDPRDVVRRLVCIPRALRASLGPNSQSFVRQPMFRGDRRGRSNSDLVWSHRLARLRLALLETILQPKTDLVSRATSGWPDVNPASRTARPAPWRKAVYFAILIRPERDRMLPIKSASRPRARGWIACLRAPRATIRFRSKHGSPVVHERRMEYASCCPDQLPPPVAGQQLLIILVRASTSPPGEKQIAPGLFRSPWSSMATGGFKGSVLPAPNGRYLILAIRLEARTRPTVKYRPRCVAVCPDGHAL